MKSDILSHSRCRKCGKIENVSDLKANPEGVGKICVNAKECKKRKEQSSKPHET